MKIWKIANSPKKVAKTSKNEDKIPLTAKERQEVKTNKAGKF